MMMFGRSVAAHLAVEGNAAHALLHRTAKCVPKSWGVQGCRGTTDVDAALLNIGTLLLPFGGSRGSNSDGLNGAIEET